MRVRKIVDTSTKHIHRLNSSLLIPSLVHTYSIAIEKMREWFVSKFEDDYFNSINTAGSHSFDILRGYDENTKLIRKSPSLTITPSIDLSYDRDKIDLYQYGVKRAINAGGRDRAFFKDQKHNIFISVVFEEVHMTFGFKVKVSTRAQQLDAYRYMQLACRVGATETLSFDMDMHIPKHLMLQIASDTAFKIDTVNNNVFSPIKFLSYLNQNSVLPFLYKLRHINGNNEYFVRVPEAEIHLNMPTEIDKDDGERVDQTTRDFGLEFTVDAYMMAPKYYVYHSEYKHDIIKHGGMIESNKNIYVLNTFKLPDIENFDEHGWNKYIQTEYEDELNKPLDICLRELFEGTEVEAIYKLTLQEGLSPAIFLNFKVYNDGYLMRTDIDFKNLIIHVCDKPTTCISNIIVYVNLEYINDQLIKLKEMNSSRTS